MRLSQTNTHICLLKVWLRLLFSLALLSVIGISVFMFMGEARAQTAMQSFPHPVFESLQLVTQKFEERAGTSFQVKALKFFLYSDASSICSANTQDFAQKIEREFPWDQLSNQGIDKNAVQSVVIGITHLGDMASQHAGFHFSDIPTARGPRSLIGIDCRAFFTDRWKAALMHELVHEVTKSWGLPAWFNETLAIAAETNLSATITERMYTKLNSQPQIPSPSPKGDIYSDVNYSVSYYFAQYLSQFDPTFITAPLKSEILQSWKKCQASLGSVDLNCWVRNFTQGKMGSEVFQVNDAYFTLLKHFYVALVINKKGSESKNLFSVSRWRGFSSLNEPAKSSSKSLDSLSAIRLTPQAAQKILLQLTSSAFLVWIKKSASGFKIQTATDLASAKSTDLNEGEVLLVNFSSQPLQI